MADLMDGLPTPRRYLAILAISFGTALAVIDGSVVTVALPTLARDLGVHASTAVLVVTVYQLVLVMTLLPFSALGSRIGLRRLYQYGQLAFLVATVLCFFARSLAFLLLVRSIQALGAGAALSVSSALIRSTYPARQLGRGLAIGNIVVSTSIAIAPTLGGVVLSVASWPWIFAAASPLALLSLLLGRQALPDPAPHNEPYDVLGALLCAATFGLTIAGLESAVRGNSPVRSTAIVAAGLVIAFFFVRRELGGIYKNADNHAIDAISCQCNKRKMPGMQSAHGRNQADALAIAPPIFCQRTQFANARDDHGTLHPARLAFLRPDALETSG